MTRKDRAALARAFDGVRFGHAKTLDLRASMPSAHDAVQRAESWLRQHQMAQSGDVLVITGRGNGSPGGVGVVRAAVATRLTRLRHLGVVGEVGEHTPGSFVVTLAPVRALFEPARRKRNPTPAPVMANPAELAALDAGTRVALRELAEAMLDELGAPRSTAFVHDEMLRQFSLLSAAVPPDVSDPEQRLQELITIARAAMSEGD